jgi:pilus assembly protein CpaF
MRPDRIIIGEVRGPEALDLLQALNTGHRGSITTVHANSTGDALSRLETMVLTAGVGLPSRAVRDQIYSAVDMLVHLERNRAGERKVAEICVVDREGGGEPRLLPLSGSGGAARCGPRRDVGTALTVVDPKPAGEVKAASPATLPW